jgi:hypothetical protein
MMIRVAAAAAEDSQDPPTESAAAAAAATSQVVSEPGPKLINYREQVSVLPGPGPGPSPRLVQRSRDGQIMIMTVSGAV